MINPEDYEIKDSKASRKERKRLSQKDRSKYKKTDQKQQEAPDLSDTVRGRVLALAKEGILVQTPNGDYFCTLRGNLKKEQTKQKNIITVGDFVRAAPEEKAIIYIEPRKSILARADNLRRNKQQLLAANVDQVLIITSITSPRLKPTLVDRYIIAANLGNLEPIIILNKIDLLPDLSDDELALYQEFKKAYSNLGIPYFEICAITGSGLDKLNQALLGKTSVLSGQSGVGKTSLINKLTGTKLRVGSIAKKTLKGTHTTSSTTLFPLNDTTYCIDTPGIRSFEVWELESSQLSHHFPDFAPHIHNCQFPNCTHEHEPNCAIKVALDEELISPLRYSSYLSLLKND